MSESRPFSDISYAAYLEEQKLMGSKCKQCGAIYAPPRHLCDACRNMNMEWLEMMGTGKLAAFTCIAIGPSFMREQGYDRDHPYCSGVVELDEGPRVDAIIVGVDTKRPETIQIGTPMKVTFQRPGKGEQKRTRLAFEPA